MSWALSLHGDVLLPLRVPKSQVFSHGCAVFATDSFAQLSVLSSSLHQVWALRYGTTIAATMRYAAKEVFSTLPRPSASPSCTRSARLSMSPVAPP